MAVELVNKSTPMVIRLLLLALLSGCAPIPVRVVPPASPKTAWFECRCMYDDPLGVRLVCVKPTSVGSMVGYTETPVAFCE